MEAIKLAILGIDRNTDLLFDCLRKSDRLSLCGLCETQPALLNRYRGEYPDISFFDDPREMILKQKPHAVLLWREASDAFIDSLLSEGIWLILRPPITGGLSSAIRILKQAEKKNCGVFVWTPWLFLPCYEGMCDWLEGQQIHSFHASAFGVQATLTPSSNDDFPVTGIYPYIFLAQKWLGLPEQIHCRRFFASAPSAEAERPVQYFSLTNLLYNNAIGIITAGCNAGLQEDEVVVTGHSHQVRANPSQAKLFDCNGKAISSSHFYEPEQARQISYTRLFEQIWQSYVEQRRSNTIELRKHLSVLAIIEAAALSARTDHPEQLVRIVEVNNIAALV
jgi:hypothetical protein